MSRPRLISTNLITVKIRPGDLEFVAQVDGDCQLHSFLSGSKGRDSLLEKKVKQRRPHGLDSLAMVSQCLFKLTTRAHGAALVKTGREELTMAKNMS